CVDDRGVQATRPCEACARREPLRVRQFLDGGAAVALERRENLDVDAVQCRRALGGHEYLMPFATLAPRSGERVPSREAARRVRGGGQAPPPAGKWGPRARCPPPPPPPTRPPPPPA